MNPTMNQKMNSRKIHFIINNMNIFTYKHFIKEQFISNISTNLHSLEEI